MDWPKNNNNNNALCQGNLRLRLVKTSTPAVLNFILFTIGISVFNFHFAAAVAAAARRSDRLANKQTLFKNNDNDNSTKHKKRQEKKKKRKKIELKRHKRHEIYMK